MAFNPVATTGWALIRDDDTFLDLFHYKFQPQSAALKY